MLPCENILHQNCHKKKEKYLQRSILTTVRPCLYRVLCRPMLAMLSFWTKKNINFSHISFRKELWEGRARHCSAHCLMGFQDYSAWREMQNLAIFTLAPIYFSYFFARLHRFLGPVQSVFVRRQSVFSLAWRI